MKISKETINSIPSLIKEKKLTYQEALDILSVELLENPKFFLGEIPDEEILRLYKNTTTDFAAKEYTKLINLN